MLNKDDFANIHSSSRDTIKYIPHDWYQIIEKVQRKNMFTVKKTDQGDFKFTIQQLKCGHRMKMENQITGKKYSGFNFREIFSILCSTRRR
jgi:hypothetical protein